MNNIKSKSQTIVYVNFTPYENTGKILDYILKEFNNVLLFSLNFHQLYPKQSSRLIIYKSGKLISEHKLNQIIISQKFVFFMLPLRSLHILFQVFWYLLKYKKNYGKYDVFFSVNAFTIWIGNLLKKVGLVSRTIFWVWDYYPPIHENKIVMLMRWVYWQFDKLGAYSDKVVFLNERLLNLRKDIGILPYTSHYSIVPVGTNPMINKKRLNKSLSLIFLGVLKKSQGLDLIVDNLDEIKDMYPGIKVDIIGSGPYEAGLKSKSRKYKSSINLYGYIPTESMLNSVIRNGDIGLAPYVPEESNVSYYGDPSKIKAYLNFGIPVITTSVFHFSDEITKYHAGIIIDYYQPTQLLEALKTITSNYDYYRSGAIKLSKKYNYKKLYRQIFSD